MSYIRPKAQRGMRNEQDCPCLTPSSSDIAALALMLKATPALPQPAHVTWYPSLTHSLSLQTSPHITPLHQQGWIPVCTWTGLSCVRPKTKKNLFSHDPAVCSVSLSLNSGHPWCFPSLMLNFIAFLQALCSLHIYRLPSSSLLSSLTVPSCSSVTFESRSPFHLRTAWNVESLVMSKTTRAPTASL